MKENAGVGTGSATDFFPPEISLESMRAASKGCRGCDLYLRATQTVFGEGPLDAALMVVGEKPSHEEDLEGRPFVGPAGKVLDRALEEAGIPRSLVYVTNTVKHFSFAAKGKRRIVKSPTARQVRACKPWLEMEITLVNPQIIICLGAVAAKAMLGASYSLTKRLGEWHPGPGDSRILATYHPSAILRSPEKEKKEELYSVLVEDLSRAAEALRNLYGTDGPLLSGRTAGPRSR